MRRKNTTSEMMKGYIADSLLLLMADRPYEEISIGEIAAKAGVNRSTYYRNFSGKEDIVKFYFIKRIEDYLQSVDIKKINMKRYLMGMFSYFRQYRGQMMLIYDRGQSYHILDALNKTFSLETSCTDFKEQFQVYYHTGGIFNIFQLWFSDNMKKTPEELTQAVMETLPKDFVPMLLRKKI